MSARSLLVLGLGLAMASCSSDAALSPSSLVRLADEPAGAHCPAGGTAIHAGLDDDHDGVLGDDEIDDSYYVCDAGGGGDPVETLIEVEVEPAGPNCADGGHVIHIGADDDGDRALDADEIDSTSYLCDSVEAPLEVIEGSLTVNNSIDLAQLTGAHEITGDLSINAPGLVDLGPLSELTTIGGSLRLLNNDLLDLAGFSALTTIGASLAVAGDTGLTDLTGFSALASIGELLDLGGNSALTSLAGLPALASVGAIVVQSNPALVDCGTFAALTTIAGTTPSGDGAALSVRGNDVLTSLAGFEALAAVPGGVIVADNPLLTSVDGLDGLVTVASLGVPSSLGIFNNAALTDLAPLAMLTTVGGDFDISSNPMLDECAATALAGAVTITGATTTSGNLICAGSCSGAVCP